jgi:hypothetical protein
LAALKDLLFEAFDLLACGNREYLVGRDGAGLNERGYTILYGFLKVCGMECDETKAFHHVSIIS